MFLLSLSPAPSVLMPRVSNFLSSSAMGSAFTAREPRHEADARKDGPVEFIKGPQVDCPPNMGVFVLCENPDEPGERKFKLWVANYGSPDHSGKALSSSFWTPGSETVTMNWHDPKILFGGGLVGRASSEAAPPVLELQRGMDGSAEISMGGTILSNNGLVMINLGSLDELSRVLDFEAAAENVAVKLMTGVPMRQMDPFVTSQYPEHVKVIEQLPQE